VRIPGRRYEDALLRQLWEQRGRAGWWLFEVPLGAPGARAASRRNRRLDALVLPDHASAVSPQLKDLDELDQLPAGQTFELIEVKKRLIPGVVGQLLCGLSMFTERYPEHGRLTLTAVVEDLGDAAMRWYCDLERIDVVQVSPLWA
jgi:hypothetical protein